MKKMGIYRLTPIAKPDDANWDIRADQGEVIVRALSSGDARVVAAEGEAVAAGANPNITTMQTMASGMRDSHLYAVELMSDPPYPLEGPREVLKAHFHDGPTPPTAVDGY